MVSLQQLARAYGLNDKEAADILELSAALRDIGLDQYLVNRPMAEHMKSLLAPHKKTDPP